MDEKVIKKKLANLLRQTGHCSNVPALTISLYQFMIAIVTKEVNRRVHEAKKELKASVEE